jgi:acetyl esterase/lipase
MSSLDPVDPSLRSLIEAFPVTTLTQESLTEFRARSVTLMPVEDCNVALEMITAPGPKGAPSVRLHSYRPRGMTGVLPCIYYIHGGGFIAGNARMLEYLHRQRVAALGCALVAVEYRLAPEAVFPGAIEDCYAGLEWTIQHARELDIDVTRLGVMGESAGGGLAAALALLTRDRGEYSLAFQHLIYPMLDDRTGTTLQPHPSAGEFVWSRENNRFAWAALLGHEPGLEGVSLYAAAARATDLTGLPPTFISCGALDLFAEEDVDYGRRLLHTGVPTELHVYPRAIHGFDLIAGNPLADAAICDSCAALARFLA